MNATPSILAFATLFWGQLCVAQTNQPADDWKPATSNQQGKQYPQINSERRVRYRVAAPQARSGNRGGGGGGRGGFGGDPRGNVEALNLAGINSHYYVSPETAHEWQSWRRSLHEFAPLLFQDQLPCVHKN